MFAEVQVLQERVEHAIAAQDGFPGIGAHQVADPKRNDYELIEQVFARAGMKRKIVSQGITEQQSEEHDAGGNPHGAKQSLEVDVDAQQFGIVAEIPIMNDRLRRADRPEAVAE